MPEEPFASVVDIHDGIFTRKACDKRSFMVNIWEGMDTGGIDKQG